jgi:hypothetical protein
MNHPRIVSTRILVVVAVSIAAVAGTIYEARVATRQREQLQALQKHTMQWAQQIAALRRERDDTLEELKIAERQLAELSPTTGISQSSAERAREIEVKAWLARVKQLKRLFAEDPARQIPEMQFLTDDDWLRAAKQAGLDSHATVRQGLAAVRNAAKAKFVRMMAQALGKFTKAANDQLPLTTTELAPYFDPPIDNAMLQRYAMIRTGSTANARGLQAIQEKAPIDEDYDTRYQVGVGGGTGSMNPPIAWIENFQTLEQQAYKAYAKANNGASPAKTSQLIPYFDPPLAPATVEKLIKAESERKPDRIVR